MSETDKYRHLTTPYCLGNGVDIGSGGNPVVPWAISMDLPEADFSQYNSGHAPEHSIHFRCDARILPFKDSTLTFAYSSHLLEDFEDWSPILHEWKRVLIPGGYMVILIPDKTLWEKAVQNGQPPNCAHRHEGFPGELTSYFPGWTIIRDSITNLSESDYSILFIAQKPIIVNI